MNFRKYHGIGNDFVLIDGFKESIPEEHLPEAARRLCDRHFGVGGDGLILVLPSRSAHFRMRMFNPDGSESEMCGNGIRCFAKYVFDYGLTYEHQIDVETLAGIISPKMTVKEKKVQLVRVDMGEPRLARNEIPMKGGDGQSQVVAEEILMEGEKFEVTCVSMGNPHCVIFVDQVEHFPVSKVGPRIENHHLFPRRTNVEFVQVLRKDELQMRVWERGAGETLACGTGACAAAVAGALNGRSGRKVTVHLPGGDLEIEWADDNHVYMTGPATEVFSGETLIPLW
ncbi:MAG: diaminopimelate epimerase [Armatimonadota bacterium]|nr:diaminopimelate epimerase [Armatimonadota bacterium]